MRILEFWHCHELHFSWCLCRARGAIAWLHNILPHPPERTCGIILNIKAKWVYFDSDGYVCYLGCSSSFTAIYVSNFVLLYALNMCSLLYVNHTSKSCLEIKMSLSLLGRLCASPRSHWAPSSGNVPDASCLASKSILCFCPLHPGKLTCGGQIKRPLCPLAWHWVQPLGMTGNWREERDEWPPQAVRLSLVQAILKAAFSTWLSL